MCGEDRSCKHACSIFWTFLYFFSGLALLGMGIWTAVHDEGVYNPLIIEKPQLEDNSMPWTGTVAGLIALGGYTFLIGILGMAGSACDLGKHMRNSLIAFAVLASIGCIGTMVYSGIATSHFAQNDLGTVEYDDEMKADIKEYYDNNAGNGAFVSEWDRMQNETQCCGVDSFRDYQYSELWNSTSCDPVTGGAGCIPVPSSCCVSIAVQTQCFVDAIAEDFSSPVLHTTGCKNTLKENGDIVKRNQLIHMSLGWTAVGVQIAALIVSGCLKKDAMGKVGMVV